MRRFLMAVALACVVSSTAFAGIIHTTDVAPPPPPEPNPVVEVLLTIIGVIVS